MHDQPGAARMDAAQVPADYVVDDLAELAVNLVANGAAKVAPRCPYALRRAC